MKAIDPRAGERNKSSKLKEHQVVDIIHCLNSGRSQQEIAAVFLVSQTTISSIKIGKTWKHIERAQS